MVQIAIEQSDVPARAVPQSATAHRYRVLDSWRGISALLVALFHFPAMSPVSESPLVQSAFLFVDFFFVLSGFVIASGYSHRLASGVDVRRFAFVRFGRLYPLHLFVLLAFVCFEILRLALPQLRGGGDAPFTGAFGIGSLVSNLLLFQGLGVENGLTWNAPSWSISTEFFAYLMFAGTIYLLGARNWLALVSVVIVAPLFLFAFSPRFMDATFDFGLIRCFYGFSLGALLYRFRGTAIEAERDRLAVGDPATFGIWSVAEATVVAAIVAFVAVAGPNAAGIAAPFVFAFAIHVFAHEGGVVSLLLRNRLFLWLGAISYSIYMVHVFVQVRMMNAAGLIDRLVGTQLLGEIFLHDATATGFGWQSAGAGLAATAAMGALTLAAAHVTWRFVEMPALGWFREKAKRI